MHLYRLGICIALGFALYACKAKDAEKNGTFTAIRYEESSTGESETSLFTVLDSTTTGISFVNPIIESEELNILTYEYLYNGGGVAAGDINNDGLIDLYFSGNMVPNRLYLNLGNFKFKDITASSGTDGGRGYKTGVTMADVNNDGWLDIYVCKSLVGDPHYRKNLLYINSGQLTFSETAAEYGLDDASYSTQAYFFDMDTDGDLDMYLANHPGTFEQSNNIDVAYNKEGKLEVIKPEDLTYVSGRLYENQNGRFQDITKKAGLESYAYGLSVAVGDFNNDLKPDLYICNDYVRPDNLFINNGDNTFTDKFSDYFQHSSFSSMGSDYADINNDGNPDLMTLDMLPREHYRQYMLGMVQNYDKFQKMLDYGLQAQYSSNALQLNSGNGRFSDIAFLSNTAYTDWSWSVLLADYDNDGWKDMFISNGYKRDVTNNDYSAYVMDSLQKLLAQKKISFLQWVNAIPSTKTRSFFFRNNRNLSFGDVTHAWSQLPPSLSNGASYADLDNDGYLDVVVNNIDAAPFVFRNEGKLVRKNNFIRFVPVDEKGRVVWGTQVKITTAAGDYQVQHLYPGRGFISCSEAKLHFGLGKNTAVSKAEITWPDGKTQALLHPEVNKVHQVEKKPEGTYKENKGSKNIFFSDLSRKLIQEMAHQENPYTDFNAERLLHHKYSGEGPATATGDVNGDGLDDVYIGGAAGFSGHLFIQKSNGGFTLKENGAFEQDKAFEDVASLLADVNKDGNKDLVVISGGNEKPVNSPDYIHRVYLNDGKGNFSRSVAAMPDWRSSGGTVAATDADKDGDIDLFIGGRITPGQYPVIPASCLLRNDNGKFVNVTTEWSDGLEYAGLITDSRFADLDKDGTDELVLAGEWMPVTVFKKTNGKYVNATEQLGLLEETGWWYSLEVADINGDGYPEILAGNLGLNSHIQARKNKPVTIHYKDFDNNGTIDPVLCCYNLNDNTGKSHPLMFRDRLLDQMPVLKKKFLRYNTYATAGLDDIFTPDQLQDAKSMSANTFSHTLFMNDGGKRFSNAALPRYTQISAVRTIKVLDINNDQKMDVLIGGNFYATDAQIGRYDGSMGAVLLGDGKGGFDVIGPYDSGLNAPGNVRSFQVLKAKSGTSVLVVRNNDVCSLFEIKK